MKPLRSHRTAAGLVLVLFQTLPAPPTPGSEGLPEATVEAWSRYVRLTEARIDDELRAEEAFLGLDFQDTDGPGSKRQRLLAGETVVEEMRTLDPGGGAIDVHRGMIHHWRGAILIPGARLDEVLEDVQNPGGAGQQQEDVLETRVLERGPGWLRVYLKLVRSKIVTATYNTEHLVEYRRHGPDRASSRTVATRIAELSDPGTPREREKPPGEDRGFLWRLNSYWRYEEIPQGVVVECESVTLSRSIPLLARPVVGPIVGSVARESLDRTLASVRERMSRTRAHGE